MMHSPQPALQPLPRVSSPGAGQGSLVLPRSRFAPRMQTTEEEVEMDDDEVMSEEEFEKSLAEKQEDDQLAEEARKVYRGMRSATGVELAPWMNVDVEAIAKAKLDREKRKEKKPSDVDPLAIDPQSSELSGAGGLASKVLSEEEVELQWTTGSEEGNAGFIVQRRKGGTEQFENIASFESMSTLRSKGPAGGTYTYLDDTVPSTGTWVYRIVDEDTAGRRKAVCQKLVEVDSAGESTFTLILLGVLLLFVAVIAFIGASEDPIQTTSAGRSSGLF